MWSKHMLLIGLAALTLAACQQNPYQGRHDVEAPKPPAGPISDEKPTKPNPTGSYSLKVDDVMNFTEGQYSEFFVRGTVPTPGSAILNVTGMPPGMTFDASTGKLTWTPGPQDANDPANPAVTTRAYIVQVALYSSVDPVTVLTRDVVALVQDAPTSPEVGQ